MQSIALKLPDELIKASDRVASSLHISRAEYMRRAITEMNRKVRAEARARQMSQASLKVRGESLRVNREFAEVEMDPDG
jgi:predicted transcriptional regulator